MCGRAARAQDMPNALWRPLDLGTGRVETVDVSEAARRRSADGLRGSRPDLPGATRLSSVGTPAWAGSRRLGPRAFKAQGARSRRL